MRAGWRSRHPCWMLTFAWEFAADSSYTRMTMPGRDPTVSPASASWGPLASQRQRHPGTHRSSRWVESMWATTSQFSTQMLHRGLPRSAPRLSRELQFHRRFVRPRLDPPSRRDSRSYFSWSRQSCKSDSVLLTAIRFGVCALPLSSQRHLRRHRQVCGVRPGRTPAGRRLRDTRAHQRWSSTTLTDSPCSRTLRLGL